MKKSDLNALRSSTGEIDLADRGIQIRNIRLVEKDGTYGENAATMPANPFVNEKHKPDLFKAYVDFEICHSFPQIIGPTMSGAYLGYHPAVLAANHDGLVHQWMNLRHQTKANDAEGKARDRIVGCIIATYFPQAPAMGWKIPEKPADAPFITARAVLFKLAEGMNRVIGDHQTSRQDWSVSIEVDATWENIGIYLPSTREIWSLNDVPDDLLEALTVDKKSKSLVIGKARGQQLAFAYGNTNGQLHFRGVGMTPNPAERTARITSIKAEDGGELFSIAAEKVSQEVLTGTRCTWAGDRYFGMVGEVVTSGKLIHPGQGWGIEASEEDPALKIYMPDGVAVLKRFSEVVLTA